VSCSHLLLVALLSSNSLLSLGFSPPDLLISICQLASQISLRGVALGCSVLAELTLDASQLSFCPSLKVTKPKVEAT